MGSSGLGVWGLRVWGLGVRGSSGLGFRGSGFGGSGRLCLSSGLRALGLEGFRTEPFGLLG